MKHGKADQFDLDNVYTSRCNRDANTNECKPNITTAGLCELIIKFLLSFNTNLSNIFITDAPSPLAVTHNSLLLW